MLSSAALMTTLSAADAGRLDERHYDVHTGAREGSKLNVDLKIGHYNADVKISVSAVRQPYLSRTRAMPSEVSQARHGI